MCVGWTNGYSDYSPGDYESALKHLKPGSAVSFNRVSIFHFGIYLGTTLAPTGQGVPVLWHFYGPADKMTIRVDNFMDVIQGDTIRVYGCKCSESMRASVIDRCLSRIGEGGYNAASNNCEHVVRKAITGRSVSYQSVFTINPLTMPFQGIRLLFGSFFNGSGSSNSGRSGISSGFSSSFSSSLLQSPLSSFSSPDCSASSSDYSASSTGCSASSSGCSASSSSSSRRCRVCEFRQQHVTLVDPNGDVVSFQASNGEQKAKNSVCTYVFTGDALASVPQEMYDCQKCKLLCCKSCMMSCHQSCDIVSSPRSTSDWCKCLNCQLRAP